MGSVVRFAKPKPGTKPAPHPDTVHLMRPPPDDEPHPFFLRMLRIWTIEAERCTGNLRWMRLVLQNQVAYIAAREVFNRPHKGPRKWKLLHTSKKLRSLAKLRLPQRPAPRRRYPLLPS